MLIKSWSMVFLNRDRYFRSALKMTSSWEEKNILSGQSTIVSEKLHLSLMSGLTTGVELKKTETKEPASPMDLARMEMKGRIEEDIQAFDRYGLETENVHNVAKIIAENY